MTGFRKRNLTAWCARRKYFASVQKSYVDGPRLRRGKIPFWRLGRVRSYVRPFGAAPMAAGPDGVRGSGPYQDYALKMRLEFPGSSQSTARPFRHHVLFTLAILRDLRPVQAACPTI